MYILMEKKFNFFSYLYPTKKLVQMDHGHNIKLITAKLLEENIKEKFLTLH